MDGIITISIVAGTFCAGAICGFAGAYLVARNNIKHVVEILQLNPTKKQAEDYIKEKLSEVFGIKL